MQWCFFALIDYLLSEKNLEITKISRFFMELLGGSELHKFLFCGYPQRLACLIPKRSMVLSGVFNFLSGMT